MSMPEKYYRVVLFGLDGTIIRSNYQVREAKAALMCKLGELGIKTDSMHVDDTIMSIADTSYA